MTPLPAGLTLTVVDAAELAEVKALLRRVLARLGDRADAPGPGGAADVVMSVPEAAAFLGLSVPTVERLLRRGELASARLGRRRVVSRASCREYLAARMAAPATV